MPIPFSAQSKKYENGHISLNLDSLFQTNCNLFIKNYIFTEFN